MAQVSMNLTNFQGTPLARAVETIRREASRYGVSIHHSELVGLIPQQALVEAARWYLQLDHFDEDQILEYRLAEAQSEAKPLPASDFLQALADGTPTPGGGSAAAYRGAAAAALVAMVARLTIGKRSMPRLRTRCRPSCRRREPRKAYRRHPAMLPAFTGVMEAFKLPKNTSDEETRRQGASNTQPWKRRASRWKWQPGRWM
jgi:glutamate formiminotransferase/formiminotetrahydrofolate cyclodeaminase